MISHSPDHYPMLLLLINARVKELYRCICCLNIYYFLNCIKAWIKKDNPKMHIKQHTIKRISICDSEQRFWLAHLSRPTHLPNACREHDASTWKQMSEKDQVYLQVNINYIYLSCLRTKRWGAIFTYMCKYVSEKTKTKKMFFKSRDEPTRI